jgi:hypothetical protein
LWGCRGRRDVVEKTESKKEADVGKAGDADGSGACAHGVVTVKRVLASGADA